MDLKYRRAAPGDVDPLHAIVAACGLHLHRTLGLPHWDPPYALERMRQDAAEREVYAVTDGETEAGAADAFTAGAPQPRGRIVGTFTVGERPIACYSPSLWSVPSASALYLNRLAIVPDLQGRGLGRACMAEVERLAALRDSAFVRLDAVTAHAALCDFYRRLGYLERGPFDNLGVPVTCFEKSLPRGASGTR
jgi:GNAT superfamily N-acetyltransferase